MTDTENQNSQENQEVKEPITGKELTPEEVQEMRTNMIKFYEEQLIVLRPQAEYEMLMADIEEARQRRLVAIITVAQIKQGPQPKPGESENKEQSTRKLKTE